VAVDLITGKIVIIDEGKLIDGILPSISIPGIFPPVEINGQLLVDGYVLANIPVVELRKQGADFIIAINLVMDAEEGYQNGFDLMNNIESIKQRQLDQWEMDEANFTVEIDIPDFDSMRFDNYAVAITHGYEIVKKTLPRLKRRLSSINV
jgi:NTE family protein